MSQVRVHNFSISLDGFGTGDGITLDAPFGHAGERLHEWMFATGFWRSMVGETGGTAGVDHSFAERNVRGIGAEIMGRGKYGPQTGAWTDVGTDDEWRGWWGPNPPFHSPVFVLTHHPRPSIEMAGGTIFHFVDAAAAAGLASPLAPPPGDEHPLVKPFAGVAERCVQALTFAGGETVERDGDLLDAGD